MNRRKRWFHILLNIAFVLTLLLACGGSLQAKEEEFDGDKYWEDVLIRLVEANPSVIVVWGHGAAQSRPEGLIQGDVEAAVAAAAGIGDFAVALPFESGWGWASEADFQDAMAELVKAVFSIPEGIRQLEAVVEIENSFAGDCKMDLLTGRNGEGGFDRDEKTDELIAPELCGEMFSEVIDSLNGAGIGLHTVLVDPYLQWNNISPDDVTWIPRSPMGGFIPYSKHETSFSDEETQWFDEHYLGQGNTLMAAHVTGFHPLDFVGLLGGGAPGPGTDRSHEAICAMQEKVENQDQLITLDPKNEPRLTGFNHSSITAPDRGLPVVQELTRDYLPVPVGGWVPSNRTPAFDSTEKSERREIHASRGGGGGGRYGDLLLLDPSWAHRGCFTVTDPDGDELDIYLGSAPMYGEAGIVYSGAEGEYTATVTYQLPLEEILAAHYGEGAIEDFFTIVAQDPEGEADEATINLVIEVMNRGVSAGADAAVTEAGVSVLIDVLANDSDQDDDPLFIESVGEAISGTVALLGDEVEYTPDAEFCCGIDGFAYVVTDQCGSEATGVVAVLVVDSVPPTFDQWPGDIAVEITTGTGKVVTYTVTAVDNCDPAPIAACYPPSGTTFPIGTTAVLCEALDHCGNSLLDAFTVTVNRANRPPVAWDDVASTCTDLAIFIPVLENDYDPDGDAFWIISVSEGTHGVRPQIVGDEIFFDGGSPFWKYYHFTYTIEDEHGAQASADVKVTVWDCPPPPGEEDGEEGP